MIVIAVVVLVTLPGDDPLGAFLGERLSEPAGYPNASAAQWMLAVFPALILASRAELPWWARAGFAGGAVVLADLALMTQSRGALYSTPIVLVIMFLVAPARTRVLFTLMPIALGVLATAAKVLDVATGSASARGRRARSRRTSSSRSSPTRAARSSSQRCSWRSSWRPASRSSSPTGSPDATAERVGRVVGATAIGAAVVAVLIALAAAGGPFEATSEAWHSFKRGYEGNAPGNRLTGGLGSNRYDFYRVAWGRFAAHPITGIGGDNFRQETVVADTITEHEAEQVERANETGKTPVVFVHGLWLLPSSWDRWACKFERAGYTALTPGWPDDPETVEEAAEHPEVFAGKTVKQVADHFEEVISGLKKKPAVVGHSFGGLLTFILAGRGLSEASVAISPAPFRGGLPLPISALKSSSPVLRNPANRNRAVPLTYDQFRYAFANAVDEDEAKELPTRRRRRTRA